MASFLQAWFGVDTFLLLEPMSYSKRVLDDIQVAALHLAQAQQQPQAQLAGRPG